MKSNLLVGDYLFGDQISPTVTAASPCRGFLKELPLHGRLFGEAPKRGDIIVFHPPGLSLLSDPFIKRLIGMPGDRIQVKDAVLYINDVPVPKEYLDDWTDTDAEGGSDKVLARFKETLPNGKSILTLHRKEHLSLDFDPENTPEYVVPPGHYFMMGDNRDNSRDSRFPDPVGYVPEKTSLAAPTSFCFRGAATRSCAETVSSKRYLRGNRLWA